MVFFEASYFSFFFYSVVLFFALGYWVLGNQAGGHPTSQDDGDDYERLGVFADQFMFSYRTSIGDLETPNANYWKEIIKDPTNENLRNIPIVNFLWFVWMLQQYFMLIVLLNFLIAIVSQAFEKNLAATLVNTYAQRIEQYLEADNWMRFEGRRLDEELYILTGSVKDTIADDIGGEDDWNGFIAQTKEI